MAIGDKLPIATQFTERTPMTSPEPVTLSLNAMATRFEIVLCGAEPSRLRAAGEEALDEIAALDRQLSFYNPHSEISRVNSLASREPVKLEPRLFGLLKTALELSLNTNGAFDITIAPLMKAWGLAGGDGRVPSQADLDKARELVGANLLHLDEDQYTASFERDGMKIDLGAIGKGFAIDRAVEILRDSGVESALIHGGTSTIYAIGVTADGRPWRVAVRDPDPRSDLRHRRELDLQDCSLSVSAVHGKSFTWENRDYGHVIDPRTGLPTNAAALAAVWGPSATITDALSTALLVLGEPGLATLRERFENYQALIS